MASFTYDDFRTVLKRSGFEKLRSEKHETWRKILPAGAILRVRISHQRRPLLPLRATRCLKPFPFNLFASLSVSLLGGEPMNLQLFPARPCQSICLAKRGLDGYTYLDIICQS